MISSMAPTAPLQAAIRPTEAASDILGLWSSCEHVLPPLESGPRVSRPGQLFGWPSRTPGRRIAFDDSRQGFYNSRQEGILRWPT
jgi:hypothetical protein